MGRGGGGGEGSCHHAAVEQQQQLGVPGWPREGGDEGQGGEGVEGAGDERDPGRDDGLFASSWAGAGWLVENPLGLPTEREVHVMQQGLPVYRLLLVRR